VFIYWRRFRTTYRFPLDGQESKNMSIEAKAKSWIRVKTWVLAWEGRVDRASSLHYTLEFAFQMRKNEGNPSVKVTEIFLAEQFWARFRKFNWPRIARRTHWTQPPWLALRATGVNQRSDYVSVDSPKLGVVTSSNLESKMYVTALMCSGKHGTHKSSCICKGVTNVVGIWNLNRSSD